MPVLRRSDVVDFWPAAFPAGLLAVFLADFLALVARSRLSSARARTAFFWTLCALRSRRSALVVMFVFVARILLQHPVSGVAGKAMDN